MRAVIFANGEITDIALVKPLIRADDFIVSADGGMRYIHALDLQPHLIIGDMDSISPALLDYAKNNEIQIMRFPTAKDETDLELAVGEVKVRGFDACLVIGALGGRTDQTLANVWMLAHADSTEMTLEFDDGCESLNLIRDHIIITGNEGDTVSLIPLFPSVSGITTSGLLFPLVNESLYPEQTRGISNVMTGKKAEINIESGKLLCVRRRKTCC